ncbi:MAG: hypothetical protein CMJ70_27180 [Planctomycetaceae bacterium]|nr:hypothetical protein [Planctomycetaceae bacterium]
MLIHNFRTCSLVCLTLLAVSSAAFSQGLQSDRSFWGNHYSPDGGNEASFPAWLPLTESENIESDFQWFAPGEFGEYGEATPPNNGLYFGYDWLRWSTSNPEMGTFPFTPLSGTEYFQAPPAWNPNGFADGGGHRVEVGWMTEENTGWNFIATLFRTNGGHELRMRELDYDPEDEEHDISEDDFDADFDQIVAPQTTNSASYHNLELNKTWRIIHRDGVSVEPFAGVRYLQFMDRHQSTAVDTDCDVSAQTVRQMFTHFNNQGLTGQLGVRWTMVRARWKLRTGLGCFVGHNFQRFSRTYINDTRIHEEGDPLNCSALEEVGQVISTQSDSGSGEEFLWGSDGRVELTYTIFRDLSLRIGGQVVHLPGGIGRGPFLNSHPQRADLTTRHNEEDLLMGGFSFGFEMNR